MKHETRKKFKTIFWVKNKVDKIIRNPYFWIVVAITAFGAFLRFYKIDSLTFFLIDQARDWKIVQFSLKSGLGEMPLLGPKAGGTKFYMGPAYYFFVYLSGLFFGPTPEKMTYFETILSILTIPLFYFFLKEIFNKKISAILTGLFSVSLFAIVYSRFSWNPNTIPFFTLLVFFSFLRLIREKKYYLQILWSVLFGIGFGIGIQLHSVTLFSFPLIIFFLLIWIRPRINFRNCLIILITFLILNSPIFIHEYKTGFKNLNRLIIGAEKKQDRQKEFSLAKKIIKHSQELTKNYVIMVSSSNIIEKLDRSEVNDGVIGLTKRNLKGWKNFSNSLLSSIFFLFFSYFLFLAYKKFKTVASGKEKNFLCLFFLWQIIILILIISFSFSPDSRLYLPLIFIPFILLGFYLENLLTKKNGQIIAFLIIVMIFLSNIFFVGKWFWKVENYTRKASENYEYILESYFSVTLSQFRSICDYIAEIRKKENKEIGIKSSPYYVHSVHEILTFEKGFMANDFSKYDRNGDMVYIYFDKINPQKTAIENLPRGFESVFEIIEEKHFGNLILFRLKLKDSLVSPKKEQSIYDLDGEFINKNMRNDIDTKFQWKDL